MRKLIRASFSWLIILNLAEGQERTLAPIQGLHKGKPTRIALVGVNVWLGPNKSRQNVAILIEKRRISRVDSVGSFPFPPGTEVLYYPKGTWVYPAFIEVWSHWGLPSANSPSRQSPQYETHRPPLFYPNDAVRVDFSAETSWVYETETAKRYREMGFGIVHVAPKEGIIRGTGSTILLVDEAKADERFLPARAILHAGFEKGSASQDYPNSKMGAIALVRQVLYDLLWYRQGGHFTLRNVSLEALLRLSRDTLRWCWVTQSPEDAFRVAKIMQEWKQAAPVRWAVLGTGYEYEWLPFLPKECLYIIPVGLPVLPPPHSPDFYARLPLNALRRWEQAPFRTKWLLSQGYHLSLTSQGLSDSKTFWEHLRILGRTGVSRDSLLLALTEVPARWLGLSDAGRIAPGNWANLILFSDTLWKPNALLLETWVGGERESYVSIPPTSPAGIYEVSLGWELIIPANLPPIKARLVSNSDTHLVDIAYNPHTMQFSAKIPPKVGVGEIFFTAPSDSALLGIWVKPTGNHIIWNAQRKAPPPPPSVESSPPLLYEDSLISKRTYPNGMYGKPFFPTPEKVLFRKATVWTGDSILPETDVLISQGKVQRIEKNIEPPPNTTIIEAHGNALTAGIIDEHSHIAIEGGVNEASEAITAEVRIQDVIDPTDVNIYRHLAGGVVAVQLLHGSANPIGGQSACVKLKWGLPADSFLISDAPPFNKFALGENVKQSNWGEAYTTRYPQTRMGVEKILSDAFEAARYYSKEWESYEKNRKANPKLVAPRRNLRLEPLAEILARKRFITCHSYVQSEILMLMRMAERYGFRIRTFTHVLEGYKVAPELRGHGAFASSFSDWWAYKYEVMEAIPHNAAVLLSKGVRTCINSDDAEMGRRLNQEAAKILRYGGKELGIDTLTAWKTVTVYPAEALGISHRTGYIKPGYDADLVLWDKPTPLSVYSRVQMTFVEGRRLYDAQRDSVFYAQTLKEKNLLLEKAWKAAQEDPKGIPLLLRRAVLWHCESLGTPKEE
ncbi:MAG: amidohydrolase family protein [Bacteroidia bacterium]|nr:amidohydrolase family protein [Bacteroidia bacterium]MDW8134130.1 amidohydrolase family protein [Bacteroidia bacterium]